jgi:acyl carrier protein
LDTQSKQMLDYIAAVIRRPSLPLQEDTPLVSSGLIDSFALVDILIKLEEIAEVRIPAGKVRPQDMDTVALMFAMAKRIGKTRN